MKTGKYSNRSFYCAMAIVVLIALQFTVIALLTSPAVCEGMADLFLVMAPLMAWVGLGFGFAGVKEPETLRMVIGFIVNGLVGVLGVVALLS